MTEQEHAEHFASLEASFAQLWEKGRRASFARIEQQAYKDACRRLDAGDNPRAVECALDFRIERARALLLGEKA